MPSTPDVPTEVITVPADVLPHDEDGEPLRRLEALAQLRGSDRPRIPARDVR